MTDTRLPSGSKLCCPTCKKTLVVSAEQPELLVFRPFCSRRCKLADLGRWLDEDFKISRPIGPDDHE